MVSPQLPGHAYVHNECPAKNRHEGSGSSTGFGFAAREGEPKKYSSQAILSNYFIVFLTRASGI